MSTSDISGPSGSTIPVVLAPAGTETLPRPLPDERDGIGALHTERGNLPLESIDVAIASSGLAMRTELTQGFHNPYDEPLEATYVFPLPARSALTSMVLRAADRTVRGELKERGRARQDYDRAITEGKRASIAEEERPGVFTMRVGNILPGESVSVTLTLAGTMPYEDGEATIRFPLVVAPRYIPGEPLEGDAVGGGVHPDTDAVPDASRITPPVLLPGFPNPVRLSISVHIDPAGLPIEQVSSSLHPVETEQQDDRLHIRVHPGERADRDFLLRLRLGDPDAISSSLTLVPDVEPRTVNDHDQATTPTGTDDSTGTFTLTLLPPRQLGSPAPRDVVFVLDRSGSMRGWKMVAARRTTARILDTLTERDRFAVLTFDNTVETPHGLPDGLVTATDRDRFRAIEHLANVDARGGTEMLAPLRRATELLSNSNGAEHRKQPAEQPARERVLVLVTDGQVGNEDQILSELSDRLGGLRVHTIGIDRAVNEAFLGRLAMLGGGRTELVESEDRLDVAMDAIHRRIGTPVLTDLQLRPEGLDVDSDSIAPGVLPALYAGSALTVHGRYRHAGADGGQPGSHGAIRVLGRTGGRPSAEKLYAVLGESSAMAAVWARARLRDLEDRYVSLRGADPSALAELEHQITDLSLRYGVLCRFTAYVAVDSQVVTEGGTPRRVTQPIELPQGWEPPPEAAAGAGPVARLARAAGGMPESGRAPRVPRSAAQSLAGGLAAPAGGVAGGVTGGIGFPAAVRRRTRWRAPELDPAVRAEAAELLARMRTVEVDDRTAWLADTLPVVRRWAEVLTGVPDAVAVRELAEELRTYLDQALDPYRTERLWLRTADVLLALAGETAGTSTPDAALEQRTTGRTARPNPSPGGRGPDHGNRGGGAGRAERPFWRRSDNT